MAGKEREVRVRRLIAICDHMISFEVTPAVIAIYETLRADLTTQLQSETAKAT